MVDLFRYRHWDLVGKRGMYYLICVVILAIGMFALITRGLNLGIDFKGGGLLGVRLEQKLTPAQHNELMGALRTALEDRGMKAAEIQVSPAAASSAAGDTIIIRTTLNEPDETKQHTALMQEISTKILPAIKDVLPQFQATLAAGQETNPDSLEVVTGTVSKELILYGVTALILGSLLIMGWIWFRYNIGGFGLRYSVAGILALVHDLLMLVGMFALFSHVFQVNSPFIAALLTVLGFSIHDTIVIFDRIRENIRLRKGRTFAETVNISLLETLARSVNTTLTVLFTLLALFFFGGPTLRDFVAAMLIGIVAGTYSSIFIASQLLVSWAKPEEKVMLPEGAVPVPTTATPIPVAPQPALATAGSSPAAAAVSEQAKATSVTGADAIARAKQAGKTARRRR